MQNDQKKKYIEFLFKNKVSAIVLIIIMILLIAAVFLTGALFRGGQPEEESYPASTLSKQSNGEHKYVESDVLNNTMGCPSIPYEISLPGEIQENGSKWLVSEYNGYHFTLLETDDDALTTLSGRFSTYFMDTVDIPTASWVDAISDQGYINGYKAEYHTGLLTADTHMHSYVYYGAMYLIYMDDGTNLAMSVVCESLDDLANGKSILDSMVYTLVSLEEESVGETEEVAGEASEVIEDVTTEKEMENTGVAASEGEETVSTENGIDVYSKDFSLYVEEAFEDGVYIVFKWVNSYIQPIKMYVTAPDGKKYEKSDELSSDGEWVFVIPEGDAGTYTIYGESTNTIYVNYYEAVDKATFYAAYKNLDPETGEPVRGYSE